MRLYTTQPRFVYDLLQSEGRFLPQPHKAGDDWIFADAPAARLAYTWLCGEMASRGLVRPDPDAYPVWAWQQYRGPSKPKPDLRDSNMKAEGRTGRSVLLSLEVPDEQVLLHDFDAWHHPLNYLYLGTQRAGADFERRCKAAGCPPYAAVPLENGALHAEIQQSWRIIFDLDAVRKRLRIARNEQCVQATFWELRAEHVVDAVEFGLGRQKTKLPRP